MRVLWRRKVRGSRLGRSVECQSIGSMVLRFFCNTRDVMVLRAVLMKFSGE